MTEKPRITVAIPCHNEATTVAKVVSDFRAQLPDADVVVCDNCSTDGTADAARAAGARVIREKRKGKGYALQAILETVDSDACVLVDGDDTYFAEDVHALLDPVLADRADMVVGDRLKAASSQALSQLHRFGNQAILRIINLAFRTSFQDVLSGYRVMNRNFMRSVPLITGGFETETELTLQALEKGMAIDGYRILITMAVLLRNHRPLYFFTLIALALLALDAAYVVAWALGALPPWRPMVHGLVMVGTLITSMALMVLGLVLNAVNAGFREIVALNRRPS